MVEIRFKAELSSEITSATLMVAGVTSQLAFVAVPEKKKREEQKRLLRRLKRLRRKEVLRLC